MNIGDYVRTKEFGINRVKYFDNNEPILENGFTALQKEYKSSYNIIDLIEVGDYVNGEKVVNINGILYVENIGVLEEINIKSILTKEQCESMEYKVKE